jgi:DNA-binding transcriptional MerR regulator
MANARWKVGELSARTGVSVRALHYYEEIGLLAPSHRTASGHRRYAEADVARLQQIVSLRGLGLSLDEVAALLRRDDYSPLAVIEAHAAQARAQLERQRRLCHRLEAIAERLRSAGTPSAEDLLQTIEATTMIEKYFTPEQIDALKARRAAEGTTLAAEWSAVIDEARAAMDRGVDPASAEAQDLARRWGELFHRVTGGDPAIGDAMKAMWRGEASINGFDREAIRPVGQYIARAAAAAPKP